jgi:hypothetical protein
MSVHDQATGQRNGGGWEPGRDATLSTVAVETFPESWESVAMPAASGAGRLSVTAELGMYVQFIPSLE